MSVERIDEVLALREERLRELAQMEVSEEQGYLTAPIIAEATGLEANSLLRHMLSIDSSRDTDSDVTRNIGVIRWCLDNR